MDNKFKEVRRKIFNKKNIIKSFFMLSLIIYISLIYISQKNQIKDLYNIYSSSVATTAGILVASSSATLGAINSANTDGKKRVEDSNNLKVLYLIYTKSIKYFFISLIIYILKSFFIKIDVNGNFIFSINAKFIWLILHIGLFSFFFGLVLLLLNIRYLKKILLFEQN